MRNARCRQHRNWRALGQVEGGGSQRGACRGQPPARGVIRGHVGSWETLLHNLHAVCFMWWVNIRVSYSAQDAPSHRTRTSHPLKPLTGEVRAEDQKQVLGKASNFCCEDAAHSRVVLVSLSHWSNTVCMQIPRLFPTSTRLTQRIGKTIRCQTRKLCETSTFVVQKVATSDVHENCEEKQKRVPMPADFCCGRCAIFLTSDPVFQGWCDFTHDMDRFMCYFPDKPRSAATSAVPPWQL